MTLNLYLTQQEEVQKAERSQKAREGELFAIRMQHEAILRDAFNRYDSDQSGYIDKQEFKRMFKEELCQLLKDDQVDDAMDAMDKSGDGKIQFDELLQWFAEGVLDNNASVASPASDMLKEALKAKRKMRRYKEKLHELLPPVPSIKDQLSILNSTEKVVVAKVPGFSSVDCLEAYDYTNKRRVFYRFLKEILQIEWIEEDEAIIPIENAIEVFNNVFLPRWNAGELTFDFYFDDESFAFDGTEWTRRWDSQAKKYFFHTTRMVRKVSKLQRDGSDAAGNTRRRSRRGTSARKKSIRRASVKTQREDTRDSHGPTAAVQAEEEDGWVEEEVMERIDPRRKQSLWDDAKRAFASADQDASGFIDVKEFHSMLVSELCEPILKSKAKAIMNQIDADGSGKIDFDEFFLWYATDKCQDYPTTPQIERVRALLKTKRRARATAMAAVDASITGSLKVKQAVEETLKTQQLVRDCKGASPELVTLLQEGFPKLLASKALTLHHQDVDSARAWLTEKQQEEQHEKDLVIKEREQRKAMRKRAAHEAALNRKKRIARMKKMMKVLLLGADKEEVHATEIQDTLENLDREILLVDQQLSANAIAKAKIHGKS
uniref:EF-hand domain-containing protein n=1 Tax=Globisporangium ultimum (strain ATCC 200006 / CBS 805.95 / DAOM BR144) TaxID=431595 RepID=K3X9Q4_GLOUD